MAIFNVGDVVIVPSATLGLAASSPSALVERTVLEHEGRSVIVDTAGGATTKVGTARVHKDFGLRLVCMSDGVTDLTLLDPIANSLGAFATLLLPHDRFQTWRVDSLAELADRVAEDGEATTHFILVGHCDGSSMFTSEDGGVGGETLGSTICIGPPKAVVALACSAGKQRFAKPLSNVDGCSEVVAPFQALHGAVAASYGQAFLGALLLEGRKPGNVPRAAARVLPRGVHMRRWKDGSMSEFSVNPAGEVVDAGADAPAAAP